MKICFVSNLYGANARGGAERVVQTEAEALARLGHDIFVVAASKDGPAEEPAVAGGVRVVRFRPPNIYFYSDAGEHPYASRLLWHLIDSFNFGAARSLKEILRRERPDVVHTHNLMGLGFLAPRTIRKLGLRHVHTVHDVQLFHPSGLIMAPVDGRIDLGPAATAYARLMRRLMGSPQAVVFPSAFLAGEHLRRGFFPRSATSILNNPAPAIASEPRRVPAGRPTFLFAGQLEEHKGIGLLLDVWEKWPGRGRADLEIAGGGSLGPDISRRAAGLPNVRFLGRLDAASLRQSLGRAAFVVVPSRVVENAPAILGESFGQGTPAVAAAAGGIPELVVEGRTGFLFKPGDADGLRAALDLALASLPAIWPSLSAKCRERAGDMSTDKHVAELQRTYRG